jgi:hypothetical protein
MKRSHLLVLTVLLFATALSAAFIQDQSSATAPIEVHISRDGGCTGAAVREAAKDEQTVRVEAYIRACKRSGPTAGPSSKPKRPQALAAQAYCFLSHILDAGLSAYRPEPKSGLCADSIPHW